MSFLTSTHSAVESKLLQCLYQFLPYSSSPSLPGPPSIPLLGNIMELAHDHLPAHLTTLAQRYGSIYRLKYGNTSRSISTFLITPSIFDLTLSGGSFFRMFSWYSILEFQNSIGFNDQLPLLHHYNDQFSK